MHVIDLKLWNLFRTAKISLGLSLPVLRTLTISGRSYMHHLVGTWELLIPWSCAAGNYIEDLVLLHFFGWQGGRAVCLVCKRGRGKYNEKVGHDSWSLTS